MTAQIAILNKSAIALASDSIVTIEGQKGPKTYNTVNKLFTLSKYAPVGVMFYGNAELMGVPWETIAKIYRRQLGENNFPTLDEYCANFFKFLENSDRLFPPEQQRRYFEARFARYFKAIKDETDQRVCKAIKESPPATSDVVQKIFHEVIRTVAKGLHAKRRLPEFNRQYRKQLASEFEKHIEKIAGEIFGKHVRSKWVTARLRFIAASLITRDDFNVPTTGVVIAGFGEDEHFPKVRSFVLEGIVNGVLKRKADRKSDISLKNRAEISAFAQADMVIEFMEGIHPTFKQFFQNRLSEVFRKLPSVILECIKPGDDAQTERCRKDLKTFFDGILSDLNQDQESFRRENQINPVIETVAVLPKDELATMAEALINITQFRQKVTLQTETVGGPIDVAVISKGDGFMWIRRKHYFDPRLNPYFIENYLREPELEKRQWKK